MVPENIGALVTYSHGINISGKKDISLGYFFVVGFETSFLCIYLLMEPNILKSFLFHGPLSFFFLILHMKYDFMYRNIKVCEQ